MSTQDVTSTMTSTRYIADQIASRFGTSVEATEYEGEVRESMDFSTTTARIEIARWDEGDWYLSVDSEALSGRTPQDRARSARALKNATEALLHLLEDCEIRFYDGNEPAWEIEVGDVALSDLVAFCGQEPRHPRDLSVSERETLISVKREASASRRHSIVEHATYLLGLIRDMSDAQLVEAMEIEPGDVPYVRADVSWWGTVHTFLLAEALGTDVTGLFQSAKNA